jgi:hypothetical protein
MHEIYFHDKTHEGIIGARRCLSGGMALYGPYTKPWDVNVEVHVRLISSEEGTP